MTDVIIPLGIPALVTGLIWLLLNRLAGASRAVRAVSAITLPTVVLLALYYIGVGGHIGAEELAVLAIALTCQWVVSGAVVWLLEWRLRGEVQ